MSRKLSQIAVDIRKDWKKPYYGAVPYIEALSHLHAITDKHGWEDAKTIVAGFLTNAQTWRGPIARSIKKELKDIYDEERLIQEVESALRK